MIKLINPELFTVTEIAPDHEDQYTRFLVQSSFKSRRKNSDETVPLNLLMIKSIGPDYESLNTTVRKTKGDNGKDYTTLYASPSNKLDRNFYFVAIPFNGFGVPIPVSSDYRIHKGAVAIAPKKNIHRSAQDQNKYKKVLYLLIEDMQNVKDNKGMSISIQFTSYDNRREGDRVTTYRSDVVITIAANTGSYMESYAKVDPVDPKDYKEQPMFTVYTPEKKNYKPKGKSSNGNTCRSDKKKSPFDGIRLEDSKPNEKPKKSANPKREKPSLDEMIEKSNETVQEKKNVHKKRLRNRKRR